MFREVFGGWINDDPATGGKNTRCAMQARNPKRISEAKPEPRANPHLPFHPSPPPPKYASCQRFPQALPWSISTLGPGIYYTNMFMHDLFFLAKDKKAPGLQPTHPRNPDYRLKTKANHLVSSDFPFATKPKSQLKMRPASDTTRLLDRRLKVCCK